MASGQVLTRGVNWVIVLANSLSLSARGMVLGRLLSQKRAAILERWFELILETYPVDAARFLRREKDRFVNPVGHTISQEIETIYDELRQGMSLDNLTASLNSIIQIRSVQDFLPSQAIAFVFLLKQAVREQLADEIKQAPSFAELLQFESRVDELARLALDMYMKWRDKVHEIRLKEVKARTERMLKMLERADMMHEKAETQPDASEDDAP